MRFKKVTILFLATLVLFLLTSMMKVQAGTEVYEAQIGDTYYTLLTTAITEAEDGDTIYVLKDISTSQTLTITGSKAITLSSYPGSPFTIKRSSGVSIVKIQNGASLTVENITFDGDSVASSAGSLIDVGSGGASFFVMKNGAMIINGMTSNGAAAIQLRAGSVTIEGGIIKDNQSGYGIGGIYVAASTILNLSGGAIYNNNTSSSNYGGIAIADGATLNISGDPAVYNNRSNKNADYRDIRLVDDTGNVNVNIVDDFTGDIGLWSTANYQRSKVFGQIQNDADITGGTIHNNRNEYLFGTAVATNLLWEYQFDNTTIISYPTISTSGLARQSAIGAPTITRDITLSALNTESYTMVQDGFEDPSPMITYQLKDTSKGQIVLEYALPTIADSGYDWTIITAPTNTMEGEMSATHTSYPGLVIPSQLLPTLNSSDYLITHHPSSLNQPGTLVFTYNNTASGAVSFESNLIDANRLTMTNERFSFYGQENYEYVVLESPSTPNEATLWTQGENAIVTIEVEPEKNYILYVKPFYGNTLLGGYEAMTFLVPTEEEYLLTIEKKNANTDFDAILEQIEVVSSTIEAIIANARVEVSSAVSILEVDQIVSFTHDAVDAELLAEAKAKASTTLDDHLGTIANPSASINSIINDAKGTLPAAQTILEVNQILSDVFVAVEAQLLLEAKAQAVTTLNQYLLTIEDPSDAVTGLINQAKKEINASLSDAEFDAIIASTLLAVEAQLLVEAKAQAVGTLNDYLNAIEMPSEAVTGIINGAISEINSAINDAEFEAIIASTLLIVEAQLFVEAKAQALLTLDGVLSSITSPSEAVTSIITMAKAAVPTTTTILEVSQILSSAQEDVVAQLLLEAKAQALLTLDEALSSTASPSEAVTSIITTAKAAVSPSSTIYEVNQIVSDAQDDVEAQLLLEAKIEAVGVLDEILNSLEDPSVAITTIINEAKTEINNQLSDTEFVSIIAAANIDVEAQLLLEAKVEAVGVLDETLNALENPSVAITAIINEAKTEINSQLSDAEFASIITQAKSDVEAQLLLEAKQASTDAINQLIIQKLPAGAQISPELQNLLDELSETLDDVDQLDDVEAVMGSLTPEIENQLQYDCLSIELASVYNTYANDQGYQYSEAGLEELEAIFNMVKDDLSNGELSILEKITLLENAIVEFDEVPIVVTGEVRPNDPSIDEDLIKPDGYYVSVFNEQGIRKGLRVIVMKVDVILYKDEIYDYINLGAIDTTFTQETIKRIQSILKNQVIYAQLDINLVDQDDVKITTFSQDDRYQVSLMIPEELRNRTNIRVVCRVDDEIQVFDTTRNQDWISFTTNHFSDYYLIGDPVAGDLVEYINLWWIIILLGLVIILELVVIFWKKTRLLRTNNLYGIGLPLAILIPTNAYLIIWIEIIIVAILLMYLIYLFFDLLFPKWKKKEDEPQTHESLPSAILSVASGSKIQEKEEVDEELEDEESMGAGVSTKVGGESVDRYNFSLKARIHQAPSESMDRFNELKNHILSYLDVSVSKSWKYESFLYKNKTMVKITLSGQTMRIYFGFQPEDTRDSFSKIKRQTSKTHEATPFMLLVKGNGNLGLAKRLVDDLMSEHNVSTYDSINQDYRLPYQTNEELIKQGLIKIVRGK